MDTNQFLSMQRILMVIKRDILENWKTNLFRFIGLYAAFVLVLIFSMWGMSSDALGAPEHFFQRFSANITGTFYIIVLFSSLIYASCILENMVTKEKRIAYLMLPATMIEKFLARFLIVTVGFGLVVLGSLVLAEITRYLLLPLFHLPDTFRQTILWDVLSRFWQGNESNGFMQFHGPQSYGTLSAQLCMYVLIVWHHSLFILGGCYWHKRAFHKTVGTLLAVFLLFSFLLVQILSWLDEENVLTLVEWLEAHTEWMTLEHLLMLGTGFLCTFTLFNWWLSYRLFIRSQVIKPKFRLL